jgi:hypothetical protein
MLLHCRPQARSRADAGCTTLTGNPVGQVTGVLLGTLAVRLVFFRERRQRADRAPSS